MIEEHVKVHQKVTSLGPYTAAITLVLPISKTAELKLKHGYIRLNQISFKYIGIHINAETEKLKATNQLETEPRIYYPSALETAPISARICLI